MVFYEYCITYRLHTHQCQGNTHSTIFHDHFNNLPLASYLYPFVVYLSKDCEYNCSICKLGMTNTYVSTYKHIYVCVSTYMLTYAYYVYKLFITVSEWLTLQFKLILFQNSILQIWWLKNSFSLVCIKSHPVRPIVFNASLSSQAQSEHHINIGGWLHTDWLLLQINTLMPIRNGRNFANAKFFNSSSCIRMV